MQGVRFYSTPFRCKREKDMSQMMLDLTQGMGRSLVIFILTLVFSLPLGLLVSFGRMSKIAPVR